jgi:GNAT superfamily N-acetyltransferase
LSLSIEPAALDDPAAVALVDALFDELNERYGPPDAEHDDGGAGWYGEIDPAKVAPPDGVFLVARWDGEPVGCGAIKRLDETTGEVKRMYVDPGGRKRGIGRAMLARLEDEARRLGYEALQLETGAPQPEAVALYESTGWARIPPYGRYATDPRSMCFRKELR